MPLVSIVTSLYRSASTVEAFYDAARSAAGDCGLDYEFVFVDDGSPEDDAAQVLALVERDSAVRLVELSRNFGQHRALWAGLREARGDLVFLLDSDMEEDPGLLRAFHRVLQENAGEADVVYGVMKARKGGALEKLGGALFYGLISRLSETPVPSNVLSARLMTRRYVDALLSFGDAEPYLGGLIPFVGFGQIAFACEKRSLGESGYTFGKRFRLALDAIFATSTRPLAWIVLAGMIMTGGGLAGFAIALSMAGETGSRFAVVIASVWFVGGLVLTAVGIVGAYVGRILTQSRGRPVAIVKAVHEHSTSDPPRDRE